MATFTTGFLLSLSLCLDIGMGNVAIMDVSLKFGMRPAWVFGLGSIVGDLAWATLSTMGMGLLLHIEAVRRVLWLGGGAVLCGLAVKMAFAAFDTSRLAPAGAPAAPPSRVRLFGHGVAIAMASPSSLLWFAAVGGSLIAQATDGSPAAVARFLAGFFVGGVVWCAFLITLTVRAGELLGRRFVQATHATSAILYVVFAVTVLARGARELA